ncbi:MAG: transporter substrate-binding domain-containing protein, partial [Desulfobacterales bacterium]|nr:transporter substrate-binding domain-containing protein [Desulfobacterales bacterium]
DMTWNEALEHIKRHQGVDMVLLITHTSEREEFLEFTEDYIFFPQVIFTTTTAPFVSGIHDLKGKRVAVEKGYIMRTWLERDV